jgi:hypothetical protein
MASSTTSPDRQHQAEERKRVQRKSEDGKKCERADERNRHGEQRNERGAPALQKNKNDDGDQNQRDDQRAHDVVHALGNGERGVERNDVIQVGGKLCLSFAMSLSTAFSSSSALESGN